MAPYVRNLWYMAAWEREIEGDALLERTLLDELWLIFRLEDGSGYAMLANRCPHRFAALSKGRRQGDAVACPYHGLTFDAAGQCVHSPFADKAAVQARVRTMPVVARHGAIWFWPGDPALAREAAIPDFSVLDGDAPMTRGRTRFAANYEIVADNLLDLSHVEYLHPETLASGGKIYSGDYRVVEAEDGAIWSNWDMRNTERPVWLTALPDDARLDEWLDMRWHAPASMLLHIGFTLTGRPREEAPVPQMVNPHVITPETQASSHYFYTCNPDAASEELARRVFDDEDRPVLEDIQQHMGELDFWAMKPLILAADAGGIRARRRLTQLRRREAEV